MGSLDESSVYDDRSLEKTYQAMAAKLMGHAKRLTDNTHQAEDILHETFVEAVKKLHGPEDKRDPFTILHDDRERACWLYRVATNKSMDYLRDKYTHCVSFSSDSLLTLTSYSIPVEDQVQFRDEMRMALAQLPPAQAELIICHYVLGYSLDELSTLSGESYESVKKRRWRAKSAFQVALSSPVIRKKGRNS